MSLENAALVCLWIGVTAYALFAGADFGGGFWDLFAGSAARGAKTRARITKSIGPVWEANHVWLIFTLVVLWTCFPPVFAAAASTLYIPFTIAAFGIILRGSAFAFRKEASSVSTQRIFGFTFALSSIITPFAFGAIAGAVASGRVPAGVARGDIITSWVNPTSLLGGALAVCVCAYTSAVLLCADCVREGQADLAQAFRRRAIAVAVIVALIGVSGAAILAADAPSLFHGLLGRGLPLIVISGICGLVSIGLLVKRRFTIVRGSAGIAVASAVWAWGAAQYPNMLPGSLTIQQAAAPAATLGVVVIGLAVGAVLVVPSLLLLYRLAQTSTERSKARS